MGIAHYNSPTIFFRKNNYSAKAKAIAGDIEELFKFGIKYYQEPPYRQKRG